MKYKTGITFGAFDPLHLGHINLFKNALEQCENLIVAVSSDGYIREIKKYDAKFSYEERIVGISMIKGVSKIVMQGFGEFSKKGLVRKYRPDCIFVGDDWNEKTFSGEGLGIPVIYLPRTKGVSGTELRSHIFETSATGKKI